MARLTSIYRTEDSLNLNIGRRQLPVAAGENLMMLMDLNSKGLVIDSPQIRGKDLEEFTRKFNLLSSDELHRSLEIDGPTFISVLNQCVQCVGCRRRVEHLFYQLTLSGHPTLDPLVWKNSCMLSINEEKLKTPQALGTILYRHHDVLNNLLDSKLRNKTRCLLHSLDTFRTKPFSETWREVWSWMKPNCRDELAVIETKELHEVLENYLKKHKFCQGCRTKLEKAYKILVGETNTKEKEKGFVSLLYANIKKCHPDKHIHVLTNKIDFLDALIQRAEPEVNGSYSKQRERHAKTMEIAQEEVLTCVGMIMYERLRRVYVSLREEERACQVLAAVGVHALCRSFDMCVEQKQGISNLELLYQEISRAEKAKEHKREQRKLKKKKKRNDKKNSYRLCGSGGGKDAESMAGSDTADGDEEPDEAVDVGDDDDEDDDDIDDDVDDAATKANELTTVQIVATPLAEETEVSELHTLRTRAPQLQTQQQQQQQKKKAQQKGKKQKQETPKKSKKKPIEQTSSAVKQQCVKSSDTADEHRHNDVVKCNDCLAPTPNCPCDVKDSGYGSEPNSRNQSRTSSVVCTPEGSEVCCSDGFCNHEGNGSSTGHDSDMEQQTGPTAHSAQDCTNEACESLVCQQRMQTLSLQEMLDEADGENEENCYIPPEVVLEYQCQYEKVQQQRQQLRETLRQNFARLCQRNSGVQYAGGQ